MKDATDITIVLDRSGSMQTVRGDTIGGFNKFLEDQKDVPGECRMTLTQFDTTHEVVYGGVAVTEVPALTNETFIPRGGTALLDAIGRSIIATGKRLASMPNDQRPDKVLFVILTDGEENSSREFTRERIFEMITHQREKYNWQFIFLGANQDAIGTGSLLGVGKGTTMLYASNSIGTRSAFQATSGKLAGYRTTGKVDALNFTEEERSEQMAAGAKA